MFNRVYPAYGCVRPKLEPGSGPTTLEFPFPTISRHKICSNFKDDLQVPLDFYLEFIFSIDFEKDMTLHFSFRFRVFAN